MTAFGYIDHNPPPTPPQIAFTPGPGGALNLSFPETDGRVFVIEASTNLVNWLPVATNTVSGGQFQFTTSPTPGPHRFFRVVWSR